MYYDALRKRVKATVATKQAAKAPRKPVIDSIAPCYLPLHDDVIDGAHSIFYLPGGRGSAKSSFVSLEIVAGIMDNPGTNAIVFRRTAATMRESVFAQIAWAIDELEVSHLWASNVSPMQFTYKPTGQTILFRGLDDATKLKSIKPRHGYFKYIWFEEFSELNGGNQVRNVLQSVMRGGTDFRVFASFNPPMSLNNWANKYILEPDNRATVFRTDYTMIPPEWLGLDFLEEAERLEEINPRAYEHEYLGIATGTGGEVFPNVEARTITDDEIAQMTRFYCGLDWGFSTDPAAFIRLSYDRKTQTIYLLDEIYQTRLTNAELGQMIKEKGYNIVKGSYYHSRLSGDVIQEQQVVICDSAEPKSIEDLRNLDIKAIGCVKYPGCVMYRIKWLQSKRIVIDPDRTPNALKEFISYEYETTRDGEFLASVPDKDNHAIDSTCYALDRLINNHHYSA